MIDNVMGVNQSWELTDELRELGMGEGFVSDAIARKILKREGFREVKEDPSILKFWNDDSTLILALSKSEITVMNKDEIAFVDLVRKIGALTVLLKILEEIRPGKVGFRKADYKRIESEIRRRSKDVVGGGVLGSVFAV